jgi:hypothetical protein
MSRQIHVDGPVNIWVATPASGSLENLGYTEAGVDITEQEFTYDVQGDENGGDQGPPVDIQSMGLIHIIRIHLTKWDDATAAKIRARNASASEGTPVTSGTLKFQGGKDYRVLLDCFVPRNYTRVVFREPIELNKGTKHRKLLLVGTAYKDGNGGIFNTSGASSTTTTTT